jgi:RNA polymerase sigma-70 factor (ECF subfamily)
VVDYQELDDRQLMSCIASSEKDALEALYTKYASSVYSLAMFMLKQEALAEEATQDVFLNIWLKASSYKSDRGEPKAWIMSVAHHKIIDMIRSQRRGAAVTDQGAYDTLEFLPSSRISTEEEVETKLDRDRIMAALATLPPEQRQVILLGYFEGYSQSEMATTLQQPLGTVKTRVRLAMRKLKSVLEEDVNTRPE